MSMVFSRTAIIPVCGSRVRAVRVVGVASDVCLQACSCSSWGWSVAPAIMLILWKERSPIVAEMLLHLETSRTK